MELDKIYHMDCLQGLKQIADESIDLICTDPPYLVTARGSAGNSGGMLQKDINKSGKVFEHNGIDIEEYLPEFYRVLKDGSHCYIMCNHVNLVHFLKVIDESGFHFIKCLIWQKCLAGKTEVFVRNAQTGHINIETLSDLYNRFVAAKDKSVFEVMGDDGHFKSVKRVMSNGKENTLRIKFRNGDTIDCTPNHPFVINGCVKIASDLKKGDIVDRCRKFELPKSKSTMTYQDGWLVGFYMAEGNRQGEYVKLSVNRADSESEIGKKIIDYSARFNANIHIFKHKDKYYDTWSLNGSVISGLISEFVSGNNAKNKNFTSKLWCQPKEFIQGVFDGYISGDGHKEKTGRDSFRYTVAICNNYTLVSSLKTICMILGKKFTYKKIKAKGFEKEFDAYRIHIAEYTNHFNSKDLGEIVDITKGKLQSVYNLEVDGNHLYSLLGGFVTHNCNKIMGTFYMNCFEYIIFLRKGAAKPINDCGCGDILSFANVKDKRPDGTNLHDSQKPIALMHTLITNSTKEGDVVLEPFCGSGTTAIAAYKAKRHYIAFEIDKEYYDISCDRFKKECLGEWVTKNGHKVKELSLFD